MERLTDLIAAEFLRPDPPQSMKELQARLNVPLNSCYQVVSRMLKRGDIQQSQIPWRKNYTLGPRVGRPPLKPRPDTYSSLEERLEFWMSDDGKDRVAAARLLAEIRGMGSDAYAPPPINDRAGELDALSRCMAAAGREVSLQAFNLTFPEAPEAPLEQSDPNTSNGISEAEQLPASDN